MYKIISWLLSLFNREEEGLDCLVKFVGGFWINYFIVKFKGGVFKILFYSHFRVQVDWSAPDHARILVRVEVFSGSFS